MTSITPIRPCHTESPSLALHPSLPEVITTKARRRSRSLAFGPKSDLPQFQPIETKSRNLEIATETKSGILNEHLDAIKQFCYKKKLFLFIRPTEPASTRLIKYGYETKSLDIHAKSANGGLAKGFIPVDAAFCKNGKKLQLQPSPNLDLSKERLNLHGQAKITTLFMPERLLNEYAKDKGITEIPCHSKIQNQRFFIAQDNSPNNVIYMAKSEAADTEKEKKWTIYWYAKPIDSTNLEPLLNNAHFLSAAQPTPLYVYAYENNEGQEMPVTGDYDLACIIPDKDYLISDGNHTAVHDDHGGSVSSGYGDLIIDQLNEACGKTVFRHGAETQNIEFAQPLDDRLICITPSRFSYVVPKESMAEAYYDLVCRRKIIKWNPAYDQNDLPLSGKYFGIISLKEKEKHQPLYSQLSALINDLRQQYAEIATTNLSEVHGFSLKNTKTSLNQQVDYWHIIALLKYQLSHYLANFQDEHGLFGKKKAVQLVDQLADILLYQERLKAYLSLARQDNAPQSFFCFDHHDFSEDKNSAFIENTNDRRRWIKTIEQVVEQTGSEYFEPQQPPRLSTTDDIDETTILLEKNEEVFDSIKNDRRHSSRSSMLFNLTDIAQLQSDELSDNDTHS